MSPSPRRLTFAVGTSLLAASLATVACANNKRVNVRPTEDFVNEGPVSEEAPPAEETPAPEDTPDATTDGPEEEEPRYVNTRAPE
jgi:hypothetical protein